MAASSSVALGQCGYIHDLWTEGLRPDQRGFLQLRDVSVEFPFLQRSPCIMRLGQTAVSATVTCELVEPAPMQPRNGFLEVSVAMNLSDHGTGIAPPIKRQQQHGRTQHPVCATTLRVVESLLKQGKAIDTESLCVLPGRFVWSLRVDLLILNDDGNAGDCAAWAAIVALQHARRPEVSIRGEDVVVHTPQERDPVPLSLHHTPLCITCCVVPPSSTRRVEGNSNPAASPSAPSFRQLQYVVDPTSAELAASHAAVTIAVNAEKQLCYLHKAGGGDVSFMAIRQMTRAAEELTLKLLETFAESMKAHEKKLADAVTSQFKWAQTRTGVTRVSAPPIVNVAAHNEEDEATSKRPRSD